MILNALSMFKANTETNLSRVDFILVVVILTYPANIEDSLLTLSPQIQCCPDSWA